LTEIVPNGLGALHKRVLHVDVELCDIAVEADTHAPFVIPAHNAADKDVPSILGKQGVELVVPQALDVEDRLNVKENINKGQQLDLVVFDRCCVRGN
jgi:hypothetical protein